MNKPFGDCVESIDHVAIAVRDLEAAISWYTGTLGFVLKERRTTEGVSTGMRSAVLQNGPLHFVLLQGTNTESQVSRYVEQYGPGIQHLALKVSDIDAAVDSLSSSGMAFDTGIIGTQPLRQAFTRRDQHSGMMFELIERGVDGFADNNVSELFRQLEAGDKY